jgi:hypothetical protein
MDVITTKMYFFKELYVPPFSQNSDQFVSVAVGRIGSGTHGEFIIYIFCAPAQGNAKKKLCARQNCQHETKNVGLAGCFFHMVSEKQAGSRRRSSCFSVKQWEVNVDQIVGSFGVKTTTCDIVTLKGLNSWLKLKTVGYVP